MRDRDPADPLDVRLNRRRTDLIESIDRPPLDWIGDRAPARRGRRRRVGRAAAVLALAVAALLVVRPWARTPEPPPPPLAATPPSGPIYAGAGITLNGLTGSGVLRLSGTITDVEFIDPEHGVVLATCPADKPCRASVAQTSDGGLTWDAAQLSDGTRRRTGLELIAFPDGRLTVADSQGRTWGVVIPGESEPKKAPRKAPPAELLRPAPGSGQCGGTVESWRPATDRGEKTPRQPGIAVCWVASAAATDGGWWVGGTRDGSAALAVTRDRGNTWRTVRLDAPARGVASVEVAALGRHLYAAALGPDQAIIGLFHSADGGQTFAPTRAGAGVPAALSGAMVPLLDGRLLVVGRDHHWYVSADDGRTFNRAEGSLPDAGRLARTHAGYVAYDLSGDGWAAYSPDGSTWRKLQIK
jgi:hypothetical protein